jgi:citrate lyase synthetase
MFYITTTEYGQTFHAETFTTFDDACDFLNLLENAQDDSYSYARELAISELKGQIVDFMAENQE